MWQERLGADANIIGRSIFLNRRAYTVIGVAPAAFRGHITAVSPDVYIPMMMGSQNFEDRNSVWFVAVGRLAPEATLDQANGALAAKFTALREVDPERYERRSARAVPIGALPAAGRGPATAFLSLIMGLAALILLITCANVAGMLLARAASREKEIAIRLALGSGRGRLVRQLVVESLVLFLIGGLGGVLLAVWGTGVMSSVRLPVPIPIEVDLRPDALVLGFGLALALGTGIAFGLAPALQSTNPMLMAALKNESRRGGSSGSRMRRVFVMGQIGLSLLLLLAAGLFLRSLQRAAAIDAGFDPADVHMISLNLSMDGYDEERGAVFTNTLLERVRVLPGVTEASVAVDLPMDFGSHGTVAFPEGYQSTNPPGGLFVDYNAVSEGYFETLRIPVRRGRTFMSTDRDGTMPVAIVGSTFAERAWPGEEPIGKNLRFGAADAPLRTVVGIADDVKNQAITDTPEPFVYVPYAQSYQPSITLLVQSASPDTGMAETIRQAIRAIDPGMSLTQVELVADYTGLGLLPQRIAASVTTVLGMLALLLSAIGVYGIVAYMVTQQTREIGIRMALGAASRDVLMLVLRRGLRLAVPGLLFGLVAGLALARFIRGFTLDIAPGDPATFVGVPLVLLVVVAFATLLPAQRATAVQPSTALRNE
jgi:predicted permease